MRSEAKGLLCSLNRLIQFVRILISHPLSKQQSCQNERFQFLHEIVRWRL